MSWVDGPQSFALPVSDVNYHHSYRSPEDEDGPLGTAVIISSDHSMLRPSSQEARSETEIFTEG
ncbi:hypothetical protein E2C01_055898 [Portunus trituberculatus]|uniref:Uncharacterized protein n=1 Tax=Portunus trituberculatus TaxID=210409 RepID=A0A5B7GNZ4_PORTR|nr:hypothetical protein [Portunus trituberculatus]